MKVCDKDVQGGELSPLEVLSTEIKDNCFAQNNTVKSVSFPEFPFFHSGVNLNPATAHGGLEWLQGAFQSPMKSSGVFI